MSKNILPERLDRKVIYESDWVSLYSDKVQMPDGRIFNTYHKLHYPHESVCVVIVNAKKWIPKDEVLKMLKNNETQCGVSILALLYAIQFYI